MTLRRILTATLCAGLVLVSAPAQAGGSDSPTPYRVTAEGIYLPEGTTFQENGHLNWHTTWARHGIHFDPNNGHPGAQYIGKNFLAWPHPLEPGECITWVQIHGFNEHFGEGGQDPVCSPTDIPTDLPTETPVDNPTDEPTEDPTEEPWTETPDPTTEPTDQPTDPEVEPEPTTSAPPTTTPTETPTDQPEPSTPPSSEPSVDPSPSTDPVAPLEPTPSPTSSSPTTTSPGTSQPSGPTLNASPTALEPVALSPTSVTPATTATGTSCADYTGPVSTLDRNLDADGDGIGCEDNLAATGSSLVGKVVTTSVLLLVGGALVYGSIIRRKAAK